MQEIIALFAAAFENLFSIVFFLYNKWVGYSRKAQTYSGYSIFQKTDAFWMNNNEIY
jgi:hypothetical protein